MRLVEARLYMFDTVGFAALFSLSLAVVLNANHTAPCLVYPSTRPTYKGAASISSDDEIRGRTPAKYRDKERRARRYLSSIIKWRPRQNFANKNVMRQRDRATVRFLKFAYSSERSDVHYTIAYCTRETRASKLDYFHCGFMIRRCWRLSNFN